MRILTLNAGSSSIKASLFEMVAEDFSGSPIWEGLLDWSEASHPARLTITTSDGRKEDRQAGHPESSHERAAIVLESLAKTIDPASIDSTGHRVVHGGGTYSATTLIDDRVKKEIERLQMFAPLHNKLNLEVIEEAERRLPGVRQYAVFDTAFHATIPEHASLYAVPYSFFQDLGIKRFGFHGISHQYASLRSAELAGSMPVRLITCHLGNGCSLAAVKEGRSVDTTMGFTPLDGLMMGSRSGAIDPGIIFHVLANGIHDADSLESVLNRESGLKGISGLSNDMREITRAMTDGHRRATLAFDMFVHSVVSNAGRMAASLGGLDALVFTGGIGEHSAPVRQQVAEKLSFLNIALDARKNDTASDDAIISRNDSGVSVMVVRAREDLMIARECFDKEICFDKENRLEREKC
ncbi:MAG: acetate/propionate family kinase [Candidatus Obscuribacterales bacterium]